jgi:BirA family biotin operon repressor/biotin-[acetyl-CoA-carboxylase] ligase
VGELNVPLVAYLRERRDRWIPTHVLAERFGLSIRRLWGDVERLCGFGFQIESRPHMGICYQAPSARLCPDLIEHELPTSVIGRRIRVRRTCASTNDLAWSALGSGDEHGSVFLAEHQTAGRGRQGAPWHCPAETGILCSVLLVGRRQLFDQRLLTTLAATATARVVAETAGLDAQIKWPNDVRVGARKIAGVLVESSQRASVLGIGLNVNAEQADFPPDLHQQAASLRSLTGILHDRSQIARDLLVHADRYYGWVNDGRADRLWSEWAGYADFSGSRAVVEVFGKRLSGRIVHFSPQTGVIFGPDSGAPFQVHPSSILELQT